MRKLFLFLVFIISTSPFIAQELHVGTGQEYNSIEDAIKVVKPGDTILLHENPKTNQIVTNIKGNDKNWITIKAFDRKKVVFSGGNSAIHFSDVAYLRIENIVFERQTVNGVNIDDGGDYETASHHIQFLNCTFKNIHASGNNDLLKMSGVDNFKIISCEFKNGALKGSGIDLVGCHNGEILECYFENMGSNALQAKGGSANIDISGNWFLNCGIRSVNLGGSTGLPYFRPINATYEAAFINVYSNVFIGSMAPIGYVGCTEVKVINNTIINPDKWTMRILQETVDESRFIACGNNYFINNLIYYKSNSAETNIGPNTNASSFIMSNNLWYNYNNPSKNPVTPVLDMNQIKGKDPLFQSFSDANFYVQKESPAIRKGKDVTKPLNDFNGNKFRPSRSIGAFEFIPNTSKNTKQIDVTIYPKIVRNKVRVLSDVTEVAVVIYTVSGTAVMHLKKHKIESSIDLSNLSNGIYFISVKGKLHKIIKQ